MANKSRRLVSILIAAVFSIVVFGSLLFIIEHSAHDCSGEDCAVCMEIAACQNNLSAFGTTSAAAIAVTAAIAIFAVLVIAAVRTISNNSTLISLKVELLN
ncbi:MAG: hypothetical protein K5884_04440 [Ruminococcus sp.]|uniref:hypothetical protein n=1 Tax=uncultured Ruminococcus sp. TaxID=165186 RepID=UPI002606A7D9|nr:hypothetical protein [uncultured Ruminococcus sp.]MCR4861851.1 hypothetical protein [Ruminococcus sp.]